MLRKGLFIGLASLMLVISAGCAPAALAGIRAAPESVSLAPDETRQLTIFANYTKGPTSAVTEVSYQSSDADVATVTSGGLVEGVDAGSSNITVSYAEGDVLKTATVTVTVQRPPLKSIVAWPNIIKAAAGGTRQLTITATYENGNTRPITGASSYRSSDEKIAMVTSGGLVEGAAAGSANITVSYTEGDATGTATVAVTVLKPGLKSITVSPDKISLAVKTTRQLVVTATYTDSKTRDVTTNSSYSTRNRKIATVTKGGLVGAIARGSANIAVSYTEDGVTASATVPINVK